MLKYSWTSGKNVDPDQTPHSVVCLVFLSRYFWLLKVIYAILIGREKIHKDLRRSHVTTDFGHRSVHRFCEK